MTTFIPAVTFTGYPDNDHKNPVVFTAGVESVDVSDEYAEIIREKGLIAKPGDARLLGVTVKREPKSIDPPKAAVSKKIAAATKSRRPGKAAGSSK